MNLGIITDGSRRFGKGVIMVMITCHVSSCAYYEIPYGSSAGPSRPIALQRDAGGSRFPDPRYRAPMSFSEIEEVARNVVRGSGKKIRIEVKIGKEPSPPCIVRGNRDHGVIEINPRAARQIPPNSWAFIFGHEIAHLVEQIGPHGDTSPQVELRADIVGAKYAMNAGFKLDAYLGWLMSLPVQKSQSHGSTRSRARAMARHFGIPESELQKQLSRYQRN